MLGEQQCREPQKLVEFKSGPVDISCLSSGTPQRIKMCLEKNYEKTWKILHLLRIKSWVKLKNVLGKNDKVLEFVGDPLVTTLSYGFWQIFYNHFKTGDKNDSWSSNLTGSLFWRMMKMIWYIKFLQRVNWHFVDISCNLLTKLWKYLLVNLRWSMMFSNWSRGFIRERLVTSKLHDKELFTTARSFHLWQHCVKSFQMQSFSGPCFPAFGLNTDIYSVNPRIQSKCGKIPTRKILYLDNFYAVQLSVTYQWFHLERKSCMTIGKNFRDLGPAKSVG